MASSVKTIFLKENGKDIFIALENQGIDTKVFENKLAHLFNRVYNNYVGYYTFNQDEKIYKLIVLPKTMDANSDAAEKDFVNYLLHYHRINNKYGFDKTKNIEDSLLSLAFKNNNNDVENSHLPLEEFEFYKYKSILENIEKFFKKHKNYKRVKVDYSSQSVRYKLDLQKNIKELDKTELHQTRIIDMMYSLIATISYNALKLFMTNKLKNFNDENKKVLLISCKNINSFIVKKYNLDKGYKLTLSKLNSFKIEKVFKSTNETKKLLVSIKSLFGFEQMYDDVYMSVDNRYDLRTTSFFIDPILFYEWYVYDILKSYTDKNEKTILFDKDKNNSTKTDYRLDSKRKENITRSSNPDYILVDDKEKIKLVIDAKWKNITQLSDISSSDYLKLKFDSNILQNSEYSVVSYFAYPLLYDCNDILNVKVANSIYFNFNAIQIDMNFEEDKNSLDFSYDYQLIEEKIQKSTDLEKLKTQANLESSEINNYRTELVSKLLRQDHLDNKDELFENLDQFLLASTDRLNEKVEEYISEDIKKILEKYNDVLENDSKKFLKSSSSIYHYYKDKKYEHFDYSMPGSGIWKLIELELNTSFVWYLRTVAIVCDNSSPWKNISNHKRSITQNLDSGKKVKLNQYEYKNKNQLQGLMLGAINLLLQDNDTLKEFDDILDLNIVFLTDELAILVKDVINIRNEHAHIKAMSLQKFEELNSLVFNNSKTLSNIEKILEMKKLIKKYLSKAT